MRASDCLVQAPAEAPLASGSSISIALRYASSDSVGLPSFRSNVAHELVNAAMLQPDCRVVGNAAGELLVIPQCVFEELLLKRIELLLEPDVGNLGQKLNGLPCLCALRFGLFLFLAHQHEANRRENRRGDQESGKRL